jgi:hypothetical protein
MQPYEACKGDFLIYYNVPDNRLFMGRIRPGSQEHEDLRLFGRNLPEGYPHGRRQRD